MTETFRTFVAVKIEPEPALFQLVNELKNELSAEPLKWVDTNNLHLTLKFLGDTSPRMVDDVKAELAKIAGRFPVFSFRLKGAGFFRNKRMPRVLFAGIEEGAALKQLAAEINTQLAGLGFEKENRPFNPHLTLARIKFLNEKQHFYHVVEAYRNSDVQSVNIREMIFYRSILKSPAPVYKPLGIFALEGGNNFSYTR